MCVCVYATHLQDELGHPSNTETASRRKQRTAQLAGHSASHSEVPPSLSRPVCEHETQTDANTDDARPTVATTTRQGLAAQQHAAHAGLLRFRRPWPAPRPLLLSDSDESDSLSDFDSIADFHTESAVADDTHMHQGSSSLAVEPTCDVSDEAALQVNSPAGRGSITCGGMAAAAGKLIQ